MLPPPPDIYDTDMSQVFLEIQPTANDDNDDNDDNDGMVTIETSREPDNIMAFNNSNNKQIYTTQGKDMNEFVASTDDRSCQHFADDIRLDDEARYDTNSAGVTLFFRFHDITHHHDKKKFVVLVQACACQDKNTHTHTRDGTDTVNTANTADAADAADTADTVMIPDIGFAMSPPIDVRTRRPRKRRNRSLVQSASILGVHGPQTNETTTTATITATATPMAITTDNMASGKLITSQ